MRIYERPFFSVAILNSPLLDLIDQFSVTPVKGVELKATRLDFPLQKFRDEAGDPPMLLWSPTSNPQQTAFMPSIQSGDYFVVAFACTKFGIAGLNVRSTAPEAEWPINEAVVYEKGVRRRIVRAMRDSPRWEFWADGEPLDFEAIESYGARRIRDRFDRRALLGYARQWGAPLEDDGFWTSDHQAFTFARSA